MDEPLLYRVDDVVRRTGLSRATVYLLMSRGELESVTVGRARRVTAEGLRRWLEERRHVAANQPGGTSLPAGRDG
jgi:excisionase family DNA binding protein